MHALIKLWPVAFQTIAIYIFLIIALRVFGRGRLGQLTVIDLVMVLLLGTCVETSMVAFNNHLDAGLVSAGTLLIANRLVSALVLRFEPVRKLVCAEPLILITDGVIVSEHVKRAGLTEAELLQAIRGREKSQLSEVKYAVLETDGQINVVPRDTVVLRSRRKVG